MRLRLLPLLFAASVLLQAQYNRSTISGSVSDPTGSPLWFEIAFGIAFVVVAITQVNLMRVLFRGHW